MDLNNGAILHRLKGEKNDPERKSNRIPISF